MTLLPLRQSHPVNHIGALGERITTLPAYDESLARAIGIKIVAATNLETFQDPIPEYLDRPQTTAAASEQSTAEPTAS